MYRSLDRTLRSVGQRLTLLAPPDRAVPETFSRCVFDPDRHSGLLENLQRFRGSAYLEDGAVTPDHLTPDGRHETPEDAQAWHLVLTNEVDDIIACAWYREHCSCVHFSRLRLRQCPLAAAPEWRDTLWAAVTDEIARARQDSLHYAELGGWAVAQNSRCTFEPLVLALATYSLARICGGALGITTATTRHASAHILARLGGAPLERDGVVIPPYFDPRYGCTMQILRFDSRAPSPKFAGIVALLAEKLSEVSVIARPYWPMMRDSRPTPISALVAQAPDHLALRQLAAS